MSATEARDLRSGRSVWQLRRAPAVATKALRRDISCDVLVIGAGISGAMIAERLAADGHDVVIVDRRGAVKGSTPASTALLQYEIDQPLSVLADAIGRERAERIWRRSRLSVLALEERATRIGIRADLMRRDSLYLAGNVLNATALRDECEARARAGFEVSYLDQGMVAARYGITGRAAILGHGCLQADPRRLAAGFLTTAHHHGARLYAPVTIDTVEPGERVAAISADGPTISARHLIFATGYELGKQVPRNGHEVISTYAIATRPQRAALWPSQCLIWEASDPYLYLRATADGRVICGGEDETFEDEDQRDALLPAKRATLERKLAALMPGLDATAEVAWCGAFGSSPTGTPTIGPVPRMANCYAAMGYGGNGITFSMMASQMLSGMIAGRGDPDADLVSFGRRF